MSATNLNTTKQSLSEPLIRRYQAGDRSAGGELLQLHAGLLHKFVKRWGRSLDRDDALQEARMGLLKAAKEYDFSKGTHFSTVVGWWVLDAVIGYQRRTARNVRVPRSIYELAMSARKGAEVAPIVEVALMPDVRIDGRADGNFPDNVSALPDAGVDAGLMVNLLEKAKGLLTEREAMVMDRYFEHDEPMSEIGVRSGVSRARIQQIHAKALRKIRWSISTMGKDEQELLREAAA